MSSNFPDPAERKGKRRAVRIAKGVGIVAVLAALGYFAWQWANDMAGVKRQAPQVPAIIPLPPPPPPPEPEQPPPVPNVTLRGRYYTTPRENGYSHEYIGVRFTDGKPDLMLTLTTANPQELAFQSRGHDKIAPLVEIARQRKMAASLIRDYVVRTALARQYEAGKESIDVI